MTVLLISSEEKIKENIVLRARKSEDIEQALIRAMKIQENFISLSKSWENILVVDRSELNFEDEKDLQKINALIKNKIKEIL